ncbi:hypothetical protein GYMLUDRAFT_695242 [Collybiopsis luxurians FD-317 M1]|uniref:Uncharacterized protein n=1 Tax=Collybiopsis luxurians FD-317 M1 TaxID=944289 RepID=A0A0D0B4U8_9AGAR|nr:hypothetical protein GYMLUDRAFT_695242 [Collybiopsis luxurians FD-317 M1]
MYHRNFQYQKSRMITQYKRSSCSPSVAINLRNCVSSTSSSDINFIDQSTPHCLTYRYILLKQTAFNSTSAKHCE